MKTGFVKIAVAAGLGCFVLLLVLATNARTKNESDDDIFKANLTKEVAASDLNPCNQSTVSGPANISVSLYEQGMREGRAEVFLTINYSGKQSDSSGNVYSTAGSGDGVYNTVSDHYTVPVRLDYDSPTNKALSFSGSSDVTVLVDQKLNPIGISVHGFAPSCKGK